MSKNKYFLRKFGIKYMLIATIDSLLVRQFKFQSKRIHKLRAKLVKEYLKKEYSDIIDKWKNKKNNNEIIKSNSTIFVLWWQGIENAPELIKICIKSIKKNAGNHPVVILDKNNISDWLFIPDILRKKVDSGKIGLANFSDYIRSGLLYQYGGIWLDSTTYLNDNIDKCINELSFWTVNHKNFESWHICNGKWSVSYFASEKNNIIMGFMSELFLNYYLKEEYVIYYLLMDCILSVGYDEIEEIKKQINDIPVNNEDVFLLNEKINDSYTEKFFVKTSRNIVNKLTYKKQLFKENNGKITNYGYIMEEN